MGIEITTIILAYNESRNIKRALESLGGLGPVLVLDSGSQDGTADIAKEMGAEVMVTDWPGYAPQRRRGLAQAKTEWVLFLDADEALDADLRQALLSFQPPEAVDGYFIKRSNYFSGQRIEHSRWEDDWQLRLFRRDRAMIIPASVHEGVVISGRSQRFPRGMIQHYTADTIEDYLGKLIVYSQLEADDKHRRGRIIGPLKMIYDLLSEFWKICLHHQGFRDGWRGYALAHLGALYKFALDAGTWERNARDARRKQG